MIKNIVIVGGGTAGWMSAAALAKALASQCEITLIESSEIGTIGVGEATIPTIKYFNQKLGINEHELLKATQGTYKLGIQFVDWPCTGKSYFHPFGSHGAKFDYLPVHQFWLKDYLANGGAYIDDYSMAWAMAKQNRFEQPTPNPRAIQSTFNYAYHFDANLYALFLRAYSEKLGVKRVDALVGEVKVNKNSGVIASLVLDSGAEITADFFIDCSGQKSLLLGEALETTYIEWKHFLPCDRAVAVQSAQQGSFHDLRPYTRSIAKEAGWHWQIPLQTRIGNGYVYCSEFCSDNQAVDVLYASLPSFAINDPRYIKFSTGHRQQFWSKNCLAVGLSAGFLEPLESTSIHLIQTAIDRFIDLFPWDHNYNLLAEKYNRLTASEYEDARDFLMLHYHANKRTDDFWRMSSEIELPVTLQEKVEIFKRSGRIVFEKPELFALPSWVSVMFGQGIFPARYDPLIDASKTHYQQHLSSTLKAIREGVGVMRSHGEYINLYCQSPTCQ